MTPQTNMISYSSGGSQVPVSVYDPASQTLTPTPLGAANNSTAFTANITGNGTSAAFQPQAGRGFNFFARPTSSSGLILPTTSLGATILLARSLDGGTSIYEITVNGALLYSFTTAFCEAFSEAQFGALYYLVCENYTSTPITWGFVQ